MIISLSAVVATPELVRNPQELRQSLEIRAQPHNHLQMTSEASSFGHKCIDVGRQIAEAVLLLAFS